MVSTASHSAGASAVGYLYQIKWALLEILRASRTRPDGQISLERLDDIAWEASGTSAELLQLKHHQPMACLITDKSDDVWRTLAVWMDHESLAGADLPTLYLVTTQTAAPGSAVEALKTTNRDAMNACSLLVAAAATSTNKVTASSRARFLALSEPQRAALVGRVYVLDDSPRVDKVDDLVREELRLTLPRGHEASFLGLLWNWWYDVALDMLQGRRRGLSVLTVTGRLSDLRDEFSRGSLPTMVGLVNDSEEGHLLSIHDNRNFVHQLRWVDSPPIILQTAIVDYYRAVEQTRLWLEDDLIGLHELETFERCLRDEWRREFAWHLSTLHIATDEDAKRTLGRELLKRLLDQTSVRVRSRYDEAFFSRGKLHELADAGKVGWHPDFSSRLEQLLLPSTS